MLRCQRLPQYLTTQRYRINWGKENNFQRVEKMQTCNSLKTKMYKKELTKQKLH